jgi:membrane protease YdiL (CAAX protease family)
MLGAIPLEMETHMKNFIQRYELPSFFLLAYVLSWLSVPFMQGGQMTWGLVIAARIVIGATLGAQGLREHYKRLTSWRISWWYLVGPLIVIGYEGIALVLTLMSGARLAAAPHLPIEAFLLLVLFGGQWEEIGWTAYALPRLQERFANRPNGTLMAALILSVFRAIWHLPLVLYGKIYWFDALFLSFAIQIIIAWLYNRSGRRIHAVMLLHFTSNIMGSLMFPVFAGEDRVMYSVLFIAVAVLFAAILVISSQLKTRSEKAVAV